ncbi:ABC transporter ATP-binding protein [Coprothermobacteraceae bacterium]|nr:ABC transporter ATP-binding protein [Coprothermobacteraceae bacterium]
MTYSFVLLCLVGVDAVQVYLPVILGNFVNAVTAWKPGVSKFAYLYLGLVTVMTLMRYVYRYTLQRMALLFDYDLRRQTFSELLKVPLDFLYDYDIGDLMSRLTNDLQAIRQFLQMGFIGLVDVVVLGISTVVMMLILDRVLFLYAMVPLVFVTLFTVFFSRYIFVLFKRVQDTFGLLTERTQEFLTNIRVLRAFAKERKALAIFESVNADYYRYYLQEVKLDAMFGPVTGLFAGLATLLVIWAGVSELRQGRIQLGTVVAYVNYVNLLVWPMMAIGFGLSLMQRANASMRRIEDVLYAKKEVPCFEPCFHAGDFDHLRVDHVSFSYGERIILKDVSLEVGRGELIGLTGPIGSGKTTLTRLIMRILEPPEGTVFVNGVDVRHIPLWELRSQVAYVPQNIYLFSMSVFDNLRFGNPDITREQAWEALEIACLADDVRELPNGLDTMIGERGVTLSGGQKQRLAIARALLADRPLLVLDDAFSALDTVTEDKLLKNLLDYARLEGKSVLFISHRISALLPTDRVYVVIDGVTREYGAPADLIRRDGYLAHIYRLQVMEGLAHE